MPTGTDTAEFRLLVDDNTADDGAVATVDVVDAAAGGVIAGRTITRREFLQAGGYRTFDLTFSTTTGRPWEFRTFRHRTSYVKQDRVRVLPTSFPGSDADAVLASVDELLLTA